MEKRNKPEDAWLLDAEVRYRIDEDNGRWEVSLVFVDVKDPKHILIKKIGDYQSQRLAEIYAKNMQRTAQRGSRKTRKISIDDYDINNN